MTNPTGPTPGPWKADDGDTPAVYAVNAKFGDGVIADVYGRDCDHAQANAHLIAAAPALLAALKDAEDMITQDMDAVKPGVVMQSFTALDKIRAAIRAAEGAE